LHAPWRRILLFVPVVLVLVCVWYVARWCVGNTMAEWLPDASAAQAAIRLAPDDAQTHFTLARLAEQSFEPEQLAAAVAEYERAAALSPNDYRLWFELGRVRGLAGDDAGGERALRRAVELAPNYPDPHWYLGNLLLRTGRDGEAFAELRRAAEEQPARFRPQVFELAWRMTAGNVPNVVAAVGDTPATRADLIAFLLNRKPADETARKAELAEAVKLWQTLDATQRTAYRATGEKLRDTFLAAKQYKATLAVEHDLNAGHDDANTPAEERLLNGGFESPVGPQGRTWYDWQIAPPPQTQINLDERQRHEGARSLRIVFNAKDPLDFHHVSQLVVVAPQTHYRLSYYVRAEELQSASTVLTEVWDTTAEPAHLLAASAPLATGTSDWQEVALEFTTGAQTEAINVRLNRPPCPQPLCPLFGKVWYDDFNLQRLGGGPAVERPAARAADRTAADHAAR
jgi:hypothetical protein